MSPLVFLIVTLVFTVPAVFATSYATLHLDLIGSTRVGQNVTFSGQLTSLDGIPISSRTIFILDDTAYTRPDIILAITTTDSDGKFSTLWKAMPKDNGSPFHFYAKFIGGKTFGYVRSETYESVVLSNASATSDVVPSKVMPIWFNDASKLWHDGKIRDVDYSYAIQNLMDYAVVKSNVKVGPDLKIPLWLKNDARWFSEGEISNDEYANTLAYLLDNNMMQL